ncbi:MAG: FtsW/RodA/SpoVE family cell cycle protein [Candidatus Contendobacter sp.]
MTLFARAWLLLIWVLSAMAMAWTVYRAPFWQEPHALTITLDPGQSLTLGRAALQAPQADREHVTLWREPDRGWRLVNSAPSKQVLWQPVRGHDARPTREWPLTVGAAFTVGAQPTAQLFTVLAADSSRLTLQIDGKRWEYDGLHLQQDGAILPECVANTRTWLRDRLTAWGLGGLMLRPLRLGGGVYCADRLGLADAPVDTAVIAPTRPGFALRPGAAGRLDGPPVTVAVGTPSAESLWRRSVPLQIGDRLIIGRTQYRIARTEPALELAVLTRARRASASVPLPDAVAAVQTHWQPVSWLLPSAPADFYWPLLLGLPPLSLALLWPGRRRRWPEAATRWRIALGLSLTGAGLGLHLDVLRAPILWPYLLAWPALLVWLWTVRSPRNARLLAIVTLLLGVGLVTLLQLGVGAEESGWSRYGGSGAALTGAFCWAAWAGWIFWRWRQPDPWLSLKRARWSLHLLGGIGLGLLLMQALFGDEGGWGGFQPFELTKLALVTGAAYALMLRARLWGRDWSFAKSPLWLLYLGPVALLLTVSGFALVFLRDFSPLVLLLIGALALAWAYVRAHPQPGWRWAGGAALLVLLGLLGLGVAWLHERPEDFPLDFQTDRIRVWVAPEQHPHSGYQLRRALEAIRAGGWWGMRWGDGSNGRAMAVPVVESDFAPTFFLSRYGGAAGLGLVGLQTAWVLLLLTIAQRALKWAGRGDYRLTALGGFAYFSLYGGAAILGAHFLVSWGSNLGFLPIMGQPMPLLSAAGSHLTLFVLPLVALAVAVEEENYDNTS